MVATIQREETVTDRQDRIIDNTKFTTESVSERILKIGQHLVKLQTKV